VRRWSLPRLVLTIGLCLAGWAIVAAVCIGLGTTGTFGWPQDARQLAYRRELVLLASLVGASLASAGVAYQAILRNPLADPYLLGVSSGASLAAYVWRFDVFAPLAAFAVTQQAFSFVGAIIAVTIVLGLAGWRGRLEPVTLLLVGVIVNAINASLYLLLDQLHKNLPGSGNPLNFLVGGLQTNLAHGQLRTAAVIVAVGFIVLLYLSGELNVAVLSDAEAQALGVRVQRLRWVALIVASCVTAAGVAVSGPIAFVGLICPHLARALVGQDQRRLLPVATALGAALMAVADAASRKLSAAQGVGTILPVGVLTGLLGGPFFLMLLWQSRRRVEKEM
jgi:iron complex transport system permease protein